ncbi:MAG TPA: hypothetical protein VE953_17030 [Terriglobales bacterium]|nr:hypothetical protein [Terriglobales bacterium]
MSLLHFTDPDGDPIAVDSLAIVAVSVGRMTDHTADRRLRHANAGASPDSVGPLQVVGTAAEDTEGSHGSRSERSSGFHGGPDRVVTLLHTAAGPIVVAEPYEAVVRRWRSVVGQVPGEVFGATRG